jgi:hypothetical protein
MAQWRIHAFYPRYIAYMFYHFFPDGSFEIRRNAYEVSK